MPRRSILSAAEREGLLALSDNQNELIRRYTFSESDLSVIRRHRGAANRLGFAVQLCYMRHPGVILGPEERPFAPLLCLVAAQLKTSPDGWAKSGQRDQTRREHLVELQTIFGFRPFTMRDRRPAVYDLNDLAWQTDKGIVRTGALIGSLRRQSILLPSIGVIERICAEAITRATRRIHTALTEALTREHQRQLDALLDLRGNSKASTLAWLRQSPGAPNTKHLLEHIVPDKPADHPALSALMGSTINAKHIRNHWCEILRLATSIRQGTVTASLMLRKLGSYPRQNGLAVALRELGRIERSLFTLDWLQSVELRRRVQAGLKKGESRNALARAVFFNRLGEMRDRSFENQRYRASGLNLVTAAIVLWNTVYLEQAIQTIRDRSQTIDQTLLQHLSPLGWEHINLTGDYVWRQSRKVQPGKFRPLGPFPQA